MTIHHHSATDPAILLIGLNHETAPVALRECIALSDDETAAGLRRLISHPAIAEAMLLSTCNRVEALAVVKDVAEGIDAIRRQLIPSDVTSAAVEKALYIYRDDKAVRHVFRVAASLDSMIVGEPQILGQLKAAYHLATRKKTAGVILNRLMHRAFFVAKRVRTETGIGGRAVSISYAAVELAKKIFDALAQKKVLLIGAGEMAELAVEHLMRHDVGTIYVTNRTFERGAALARRFNGIALRFEELAERLKEVDIIVSSTGSPDFVIRRREVKGVMRARRNRPLFFIDIAVPRDIDPYINRLPNYYVYDIDDLKGVIEDNLEDRKSEGIKGERIIDEAVMRFREWRENLNVVPTIVDLHRKLDDIAAAELDKTLQGMHHLTQDDRSAFEKMAAVIVNKILHDPTMLLKSDGTHFNKSLYLDVTRKLFNLDD